jgi:hypothetical protein
MNTSRMLRGSEILLSLKLLVCSRLVSIEDELGFGGVGLIDSEELTL